jgi:hypothetical protein
MQGDQQYGDVCGLDADGESNAAELAECRVRFDIIFDEAHNRENDIGHGLEDVALNEQQYQPGQD